MKTLYSFLTLSLVFALAFTHNATAQKKKNTKPVPAWYQTVVNGKKITQKATTVETVWNIDKNGMSKASIMFDGKTIGDFTKSITFTQMGTGAEPTSRNTVTHEVAEDDDTIVVSSTIVYDNGNTRTSTTTKDKKSGRTTTTTTTTTRDENGDTTTETEIVIGDS